jgi:NitT/TauT family transport system substrate-binding protein
VAIWTTAITLIVSIVYAQSSHALVKIRVGGTEGMNHSVPFFVAMKHGFFKDAGLDVRVSLTTPGAAMDAALRAGELDVAMASTAQFLASIAQGVIRGKVIGEDTDKTYLMVARSGITSPAQLRGKTFAVSGLNSGDHVWAQAVLSHYGVKPGEVNWVAVGNPGTRLAALVRGSVDATQMNAGSMPEKAKRYVLLNVEQSPISWIAHGIFANQKMIDSNKPALQKFLAAIGKGANLARANPGVAMTGCMDSGSTEAVCKDIVAFFLGSKNPYNWSSTSRVDRPAVEAMLPGIAAVVPAAKGMKPEDFVDFSIAGGPASLGRGQ